MSKPKSLSAALIAVAVLATPSMARESRASARHLSETINASTRSGAHDIDEKERFRGYGSRDLWGQWGTYYGPMIPSAP
jgi:hypothetical protein